MNSRRAISLVELLVTMSTCTVFLTLTGVLLQRAMRVQIESRAVARSERTALRLANQFRRDVHDAANITVTDTDVGEAAFLRLELHGGRSVEYSRRESVIQRVESGADKPSWREEFAFPVVGKLTIEQDGSPPRLALTVTATPAEPQSTGTKPLVRPTTVPLHLHVDASVGQHHRFRDPRGAVEGSR
jgi:hypothetical protein